MPWLVDMCPVGSRSELSSRSWATFTEKLVNQSSTISWCHHPEMETSLNSWRLLENRCFYHACWQPCSFLRVNFDKPVLCLKLLLHMQLCHTWHSYIGHHLYGCYVMCRFLFHLYGHPVRMCATGNEKFCVNV